MPAAVVLVAGKVFAESKGTANFSFFRLTKLCGGRYLPLATWKNIQQPLRSQ